MYTITGPFGFAYHFVKNGKYDQDEMIELMSTVDSINNLHSEVSEDSLTFYFELNNNRCDLLKFTTEPPKCSLEVNHIRVFLIRNGILPFESDEFFSDIDRFLKGDTVDLDTVLAYQDLFIIAIYRFLYTINYHD